MYYPKNGPRSYNPQTKHAERMILPSSSQIYSQTYLWVRGSWETDRPKGRISSSSFFFLLLLLLSHTKLLTSIAYKLKQLLSYFTHRMRILHFFNGMGPRLGNGISLVSSLFWGVEYDRPSLNPFCFWEKNFLLLICEAFRAHEMRSQLEVTDINLTV